MQPNPGGDPGDGPAAVGAAGDLLEGSPYRVLGLLGQGGMGEVFEAEHRALGHRVVVKVLRTQYADRADMHDRMRVEGQALARIRHPHLVMVSDFGQTRSGRPYVVMERLAGRSLREELQARAVLPVGEAIEIARQMLLGLAAAHAAGLVHRDIKPDNVFLCATEDGRPFVKLLDFGVVKIVQAGRDPRTPSPLQVPTAEGVSLGTPRYFSPEQARGDRNLDARSDLYAVGLVLYAMVVGRGPFDHYDTHPDLFRAHALEAPMPPSTRAPQALPAAFERAVLRALAKPPEERFQEALAFAAELGRLLVSLGPEGTRFGGASPVLVGPFVGRGLAEATTAPMVPAYDPDDATATASPAISGGGGDPRATARKLSDQPVMLDGVVQRVLSNPPEHVAAKERLSRSGNLDRTEIDALPAPRSGSQPASTVKMEVVLEEPLANASRPVPAPRSGMPETVPMMDLAELAVRRPADPARASYPPNLAVVPLVAAASGDPSAQAGRTISLPTLRGPARASAWKVPVAIAALVLAIAALVLVLVLLWR